MQPEEVQVTRESMEFDIVIVGGGPAGLATACHLAQLSEREQLSLSICLIEKGSEIGAHIVSGAILETRTLDELFPDWQNRDAPVKNKVSEEALLYLRDADHQIAIPGFLQPPALHNANNYVISLANFCRWLGEQAEQLGVEMFAGFSASELLYNPDGSVKGVLTGDLGLDKQGNPKSTFEPGYELLAKHTVLAEGCRGHLGKQVIEKFKLDADATPQHYALGIKEIWEIPAEEYVQGKIVHTLGWPLGHGNTTGGGFLYHADTNQVAVGLITDLNYDNPWLSPYEEFQKLKHHPAFAALLAKGKRVAYGARALSKGGLQSLPQLTFPGGLLVGDDAGFLNFLKLKGTHTAMKSGMLAAESIVAALQSDSTEYDYQSRYEKSWLYKELYTSRNSAPAMHKFGTLVGAAFNFIDQVLFRGKLPLTLKDNIPDHASLKSADKFKPLVYPAADNKLSFDRNSSVFLSNTNHEEDQPCHLKLKDSDTPIQFNLPQFEEPAQRYCPAGVYEVIREESGPRFQINAQNCVHCKTCDIKDPTQNITWVTPEGSGGPNYPNM